MAHIKKNLQELNEQIALLADKAGRSLDSIRLVAVSKKQPLSSVTEAMEAGQQAFGESTLQDAMTKIPHIEDTSVEWHFIGHVQSKKAKNIPKYFNWLHSLDSLRLAQKLQQTETTRETTSKLKTLIQVNATADPKKFGLRPDEVAPLLDQLLNQDFSHLDLRGLMTIGPQTQNESELRACFAQLRELREQCQERYNLSGFDQLSMGMSNDYPAAIAEGATLIRIGSAIFGERS
jgi:PLP dependent protein